ncbi:MAG: DUF1828 domain-containing protein [Candidatus Cloacimonetes bacterium]|nr:DUF1828 domain-containing protein [Candidatus Cloacimonadota bacterium]MCF7813010.1 DUF1828 domain-containing protein [Candidatus Cloacimonadota bacterium]MCF7867258.1 DUF1828 domain-containing protein [Candidatus Cloacimonadota bacterium]MCF7882702.1 DUF1828 domain-containing protein [Candidatus Cloacimonadota bacterium]
MNYLDIIKAEFNNKVSFVEKRPGIYQLICPLYHEDGDMVDVFISEISENIIRISDYGMTIMRLSYTYDLNTENKIKIFNQMIKENNINSDDGKLYIDSEISNLFSSIMHFSHVAAKVSNMKYFKREMIKSLFYEMLEEYIDEKFSPSYKIEKNIYPIPERDDLEVDFSFILPNHPIYLFGVKDVTKARLTTISNLEFYRNNLNFKSFIVYEDINNINAKDRNRLLSASDKQFPSFEDFKLHGEQFIRREAKIS